MDTQRNRFGPRRPQSSTSPQLIRLVVGLGLVLVFMYMAWQKAQEKPQNLGGPPAIKINRPAPNDDSSDSQKSIPQKSSAENPLPNIPTHFIESAKTRDYTLAMGMVLVYTAILYTANTLVDLSYRLIDPRVKLE